MTMQALLLYLAASHPLLDSFLSVFYQRKARNKENANTNTFQHKRSDQKKNFLLQNAGKMLREISFML